MAQKDKNRKEATMQNNQARKDEIAELRGRVQTLERWVREVEKTFQRASR